MLAPHIEFWRLIQFHDLAVDARAHEAGGLQFFDEFRVLALALGNGRREQHHGGPFRMLENRIDHLAHRLGGEVDVVVRAARRAGAGKQQPQIIVDFGNRAHGGSRVVRS